MSSLQSSTGMTKRSSDSNSMLIVELGCGWDICPRKSIIGGGKTVSSTDGRILSKNELNENCTFSYVYVYSTINNELCIERKEWL
ncbi:hypothetical protein EON65_42105 [archaeon]|nr:MAG: hypothetical protein EON65_42105 [archaeon]